MSTQPDPDEVPDVTIGTVPNRDATLALDGDGVQGHTTELRTLAQVFEHFDRLVRIVRAHASNLTVQRVGRIVEVKDAARLVASPPVPGSFAVPLHLEWPEGRQLPLADGAPDELEQVVGLLALDDEAIVQRLTSMPERVGDEYVGLLKALVRGKVDLRITLEKEAGVREAVLTAAVAKSRQELITEDRSSAPGTETVEGLLFRIDTRSMQIAVDTSNEGESAVVAQIRFTDDQLESLRRALHHQVELEVSVVETRRRFERSAHSRSLSLDGILSAVPNPKAIPD